MNTEFKIDVNGAPFKVYMQSGFFNHGEISHPLHKHLFEEIHVFLSGNAVLKHEGEEISLHEGDALLVPANGRHEYITLSQDSRRISFLLEGERYRGGSLQKRELLKELLTLLCGEIQTYVLTGRDGKLKALLSYVCSEFFSEGEQGLLPITSRELLVEEFFAKKYHLNVTLDDLARELMLSTKQTEREVKRITGRTFVGELSRRRIRAAMILSKTTTLSLAKISELVGYSSYCGFYKAYQRMAKTDLS